MKLNIAANLSLPLETVTQTFAILAKRGVGKTHTAVVMTEEILKAGQQVVVCDPIGVWFGLRSSKDGKSAGLPIVILGGDHADAPLDVAGGQVIADLVIDERLSVILDLSRFRKGEQTRFMTDFSERLYHRNRAPLHLMMDEADAFAPQRPMKGEERMLGAVEDLVRRGRARGLGITLVTQRSAVLNKNVLSQVEVLVALRTIAPQDREAIDAWINVHGTQEQRKELMSSLPSLPIGEAWFWSPGWLGLFERVNVRDRETFDSSATPKVGQRVQARKLMAEVDLAKLRERLSATIEKARADDPQILRKRIAELERELRRPKPAEVDKSAIEDAVEVVRQRWKRELEEARRRYEARIQELTEQLETARELATRIVGMTPGVFEPPPDPIIHVERPKPRPAPASNGSHPLSRTERAILTVLARYPQRTRVQVGILSGYSHSSGGFNGAIARLRAQGWIEGPGGAMRITEAGKGVVGEVEQLPTGEDLINYWLNRFTGCQRAVLEMLTQIYPQSTTREELAEATGYSNSSGGFNSALAELRALELINKGKDIKASEVFFE